MQIKYQIFFIIRKMTYSRIYAFLSFIVQYIGSNSFMLFDGSYKTLIPSHDLPVYFRFKIRKGIQTKHLSSDVSNIFQSGRLPTAVVERAFSMVRTITNITNHSRQLQYISSESEPPFVSNSSPLVTCEKTRENHHMWRTGRRKVYFSEHPHQRATGRVGVKRSGIGCRCEQHVSVWTQHKLASVRKNTNVYCWLTRTW